MKVRHKGGPKQPTWDVIEESSSFYLVHTDDSRLCVWALPKSSYEPVHDEPRWVDVTEQCECTLDGLLLHSGENFITDIGSLFDKRSTYRLRKVQVREVETGPHLFGELIRGQTKWAFFVERKVES